MADDGEFRPFLAMRGIRVSITTTIYSYTCAQNPSAGKVHGGGGKGLIFIASSFRTLSAEHLTHSRVLNKVLSTVYP